MVNETEGGEALCLVKTEGLVHDSPGTEVRYHSGFANCSWGAEPMPAVKSSLVHPSYKTEYRVRNWREYEQGYALEAT